MSLESLLARWEAASESEKVARRRLDAEIIRVSETGVTQAVIAKRLGWYPARVAGVLASAGDGAESIISDGALNLTEEYTAEIQRKLWKAAPEGSAEMRVHWAPQWARRAFARSRPDPATGIKASGGEITDDALHSAKWLVSGGISCPILNRRGGRVRYARPDGIWYEATFEQVRRGSDLDLIA